MRSIHTRRIKVNSVKFAFNENDTQKHLNSQIVRTILKSNRNVDGLQELKKYTALSTGKGQHFFQQYIYLSKLIKANSTDKKIVY